MEHCKIRFMIEPFSGKVMAQVKVTYDLRGGHYDHWSWTCDLRYLMKASCLRPKVFNMTLV